MRRAILSFAVALVAMGAVLTGCHSPPPSLSLAAVPTKERLEKPFYMEEPAPMAPPATQAPPPLSDTDEVAFYDLVEAHGLKVSIDLVTGRRVCTGGTNRVVVMPSARSVTINGTEHPLTASIRWREGALVLPGECRSLFAEHLRLGGAPDVAGDPSLFDGREVPLGGAGWEPTSPRPASATRSSKGATRGEAGTALPAAWRSNSRREWKYIVIHHSATPNGGADSFGREHQKKWPNGLGYHFVIGNGTDTNDGQVEVGPRWKRQGDGIDGAHAGNEEYNKFGIGVCIVGDFNTGRPSRAQLAALRTLCRSLMQRYGIPKSHIRPHCDVRKGHTDCPGKHFQLPSFISSL